MAKIVTVTTKKGGAGKTTLALLLATGEALRGERVLLVDLDQKGMHLIVWSAITIPAKRAMSY
ncbi:ParA family protein [Lactobacillus delbrueckii]|uniref:ParA family protein n=1 Tax=Lactobacillus delbrueckii TaxID=1584 RepID=UPI0021A84D60|nr:ParA family protein [Lactobacillus delbrueckii]